MDNALIYVASVHEAFRDEPGKFEEFFRLTENATANRIDEASIIAIMTGLMKGHQNLLEGFSVFFPKAKINIHPGAEQLTKAETLNFLKNLKKRFQTVDTHVYMSFLRTLNMYKEGKKSQEKVHKKVYSLLYYHEDLTGEFSRIVQKL